jgi:prepilin-type N-terminal cleavage/methylation domain-containing protein
MSHCKGHKRPAAGFTLLEVMVSTLIFGTVSVAVMGAFLFLGTSITRMAYAQQLEENSRRAFYLFNQDVTKATKVSSAADATLILTLPSTTVKYAYDSSAQTVTRYQPDTSVSGSIVLKNLTAFDFNYFNNAGTSITVPQSASTSYKAIKAVQFSFTASLGTTIANVAGTSIYQTSTRYQTVSPMVFMRNTAPRDLLP